MDQINNHECQIEFGKYIRTARENRSLTQSEMATLVGIGQSYYSSIENGKKNVDLAMAIKICHILRVDMKSFIKKYL